VTILNNALLFTTPSCFKAGKLMRRTHAPMTLYFGRDQIAASATVACADHLLSHVPTVPMSVKAPVVGSMAYIRMSLEQLSTT
jgi:hypothetical protein